MRTATVMSVPMPTTMLASPLPSVFTPLAPAAIRHASLPKGVTGNEAPPAGGEANEIGASSEAAPAVGVDEASLKADAVAAANGDFHAARRAAAARMILAAGRLWSPQELLAEGENTRLSAPTVGKFLRDRLMNRAIIDKKAAEEAERGGPAEWLAAKLVMRPQAALLQRKARSVDPNGGEKLISSQRAGFDPLMARIQGYVPSLRPERIVSPLGLFTDYDRRTGFTPAGYAMTGFADADRLTWLQVETDEAVRIHTAVHEGIHMGDEGYFAGWRSAELLYGREQGSSLANALVEGYTEFRAREVLTRIHEDAEKGVKGLPREFESAVNRRAGGFDEFMKSQERHPYHEFVRMAGAIVDKGGRDAFVSRGDIVPLYFLLGPERLAALARIAKDALWLNDKIDPNAAVFLDATGLQLWVQSRLTDAVAGAAPVAEQLEDRESIARMLTERAMERLRAMPRFLQEGSLFALTRLDLKKRLEAGEAPKALEEGSTRRSAPGDCWPSFPTPRFSAGRGC